MIYDSIILGDNMNSKGFTMVELISVICILAIIAIIAVPTYTKVSQNIKEGSRENKESVIKSQMLKYANQHLLDEIKPAGKCTQSNNNQSCKTSCCKSYDLYDYILKNNIYSVETVDSSGEPIIIDPVTGKKLCGDVVISYDTTSYKLTGEFVRKKC